MSEWVADQLALLRAKWPDLVYAESEYWVLLPGWHLPDGWSERTADLACRIPPNRDQAPYAFCINAAAPTFNGQTPTNWGAVTGVPFPGQWSQFSWAPDNWWSNGNGRGPNMLTFVRSFADRLAEGA